MDALIRQATIEDFAGVGQVFREELQFHSALLPDRFQVANPVMTLDWFQEVLDNPQKALFVAEVDRVIVGALLLEILTAEDDPILRPRRFTFVHEVAVLQTHQGCGIGQILMQQAQLWSLERRIDALELQVWEKNLRAIAFYERLGYQTIRRTMQLRLPSL